MAQWTTVGGKLVKQLRTLETPKPDLMNPQNNIETGHVILHYNDYQLEEKSLWGEYFEGEKKQKRRGKLTMCMPENFQLMPESWVWGKYRKGAPELVYSNTYGTESFTFSIDRGEIQADELLELCDILQKQVQRLHPGCPVGEVQIQDGESLQVATFDYELPVIDGTVYQYMFFTVLEEGLLIGNFSCNVHDKEQWEPVLSQCIKKLHISQESSTSPLFKKERRS